MMTVTTHAIFSVSVLIKMRLPPDLFVFFF
jgi:hypothetical protein